MKMKSGLQNCKAHYNKPQLRYPLSTPWADPGMSLGLHVLCEDEVYLVFIFLLVFATSLLTTLLLSKMFHTEGKKEQT